MCYSAESSGGTFLFVCAVCSILALQGKIAIALILLVTASMQLIEYVIWKETHKPTCTTANYIASSLIPIILGLQPLIISLIVMLFNVGYLPNIVYLLIFVCSIFISAYTILHVLRNPRKGCVKPEGEGRLQWDIDWWIYDTFVIPYYISMLVLFLTLKPYILGTSLFAFYLTTRVYTGYRYPGQWPSVWCHTVNAGSILALLVG